MDESTPEVARRLAGAVCRGDFATLAGCLDADVRVRALIPPGFREAAGRDAGAALLRGWFATVDSIEPLTCDIGPVGGRTHLAWRLRMSRDGGHLVVEQHAFADVAGGLVTRLDVVCSGFLPEPDRQAAPPPEHFDAGIRGCADGLAADFRARMIALPAGRMLAVTVRDPAATSDLPALARMLGHRITATRRRGDGATTITVEKRT